jgi:hypothetical protein
MTEIEIYPLALLLEQTVALPITVDNNFACYQKILPCLNCCTAMASQPYGAYSLDFMDWKKFGPNPSEIIDGQLLVAKNFPHSGIGTKTHKG